MNTFNPFPFPAHILI